MKNLLQAVFPTRLGFSISLCFLLFLSGYFQAEAQGFKGYYQHPEIHDDRIVFVAEGDLWAVSLNGGLAQRLTTHPGEETHPSISPDGKTIAFTATYEGPAELYTMPISGGLPQRWTYEPEPSVATCWTPQGEIVYTTSHFSTLPDLQLVKLNIKSSKKERVPLSQASEGNFDNSGKTLFFVRPSDHRNVTKRYKGGTARRIWKFTDGAEEAVLFIESFILEKLMRKAWFYWKGRVGEPYWNMQYAFRGHMVVLCDRRTASDGEAFAEGFKRLGMGKVIGTRTWGGEIWLGSANRLTDGGLARAPMTGVYGPEGEWLIEGHGVEPDIEVDNLPHATFKGEDAQLDAAIKHLQELMKKDPRKVPPLPAYPDKSFNN